MARDYEAELREQTEKWTKRIREEMENVTLENEDRKDFLDNINAYIQDSGYFLEKGDLVRSFEAIVWAWSWLEIGMHEGVLKKKTG
ncbi:MAG: DUF357 domain-containing protein [Candidatus Micrarchaeota archaeon]|nr:DUF357 domain-containing protein [Candidatus Micrarchaeota archaeon]